LLHHSFARKIRHFELLHQRETQFKCFVNKCIYAGSCIKSLCTHLQDCHARNHLKEATLGPLAATFENFKFKCVITTCGVVHNTVSRLKAHLFRHHKELKKDCIYSGCRYSTSNCFTLKSHFSRMHNSQEDIHIKAEHRVGSGPLQVGLPQEEAHVDELESSEDEDGDEDAPAGDEDPPPGAGDGYEDEQFAHENYSALK